MPYQVRDTSSGAAALTSLWTRSAIARSAGAIAAIAASTSFSPSAGLALPFRAACTSRRHAFTASFSSAVTPISFFVGLMVVFLAGLLDCDPDYGVGLWPSLEAGGYWIPAFAGMTAERLSGDDRIEVDPVRVAAFNQSDLPGAFPFLDLLLAPNGGFRGRVLLVIDEAM